MDEHSMMSEFDFRALPPLPDSPVTTTRAFPSSPFQIRSHFENLSNEAPPMPSMNKETTYARHAPIYPSSPLSPTKSKQPQTYTARIPSSESQADNYLPTSFLLRSPSKHLSPTKVPLPPSPTRPIYALPSSPIDESRPAPPPPAAAAAGDASFLLPQQRHYGRMSDTGSALGHLSQSMIADMSMPDLMSLEIDESLVFGLGSKGGAGGLKTAQDLREGIRVSQPPGIGEDRDQQEIARADPTPSRRERSPVKTESRSRPCPTPSSRLGRSPTKPTSTSAPTASPSPSKTKRTFPASSSHTMLSRLGEEAALDVSTLYPRTPTRMAYLLDDRHQLLRTSLPSSESEGDSVLFAPSPPPVSSRKTPRKASPVKDADMTMDVAQMMARMGKPKRPSGTEESFVDLMHGTELDLDESIMFTGDILPPDLRPRTKSLGTHFQARTTSASVKTMDLGQTGVQSPAKETTRAPITSASDRHRPSPAIPQDSPRRHISPTKPIPERSAVPHPPTARRLAQAPISTRRPSLSAGAIPLPTTASYTKMELPKPMASRHERTRSAMHPADILGGQRQTGLARPRPESELAAKTTVPAPRNGTTTTSARLSAMPPPPRPAVPRSGSSRTGASALPSAARAAPISRPAPGSIAPPTSRMAAGSMAPPARPASFRPTSMAPPSKSSLPPTSTRTALRSSAAARPALVRPSASASRTFGADGTAQTNRTNRPTPGGLPSKTTIARAIPGKMSMAPTSSPSKREATSAAKSRAASTPAEVVARTMVRPTTSTKSSIPPTATTSGSRLPGLPRPTSRLPAPGTKLSGGAGTTTATGGRERGTVTTSIASLRARIDEISARQAANRRPVG